MFDELKRVKKLLLTRFDISRRVLTVCLQDIKPKDKLYICRDSFNLWGLALQVPFPTPQQYRKIS